MKRQYFKNLSFSLLLFAYAFLSSCTNDETEIEKIIYEGRTMTFDVSQSFNESPDEQTRGFSEKSDTVYQELINDLKIATVVEQDKATNSRVLTETVAEGTKVLAFIIEKSSNRIYKIEELEVSNDHRLSCEVPNVNVEIVFYSYNSTIVPTTILSEGDYISSETAINTEYVKSTYNAHTPNGPDLIFAKTGTITPNDYDLGTITFKHLFSRYKVRFHYDQGVKSFQINASSISASGAEISINTGEYLDKGGSSTSAVYAESNTIAESLDSEYRIFIPRDNISDLPIIMAIEYVNGQSFLEVPVDYRSTTLTRFFDPGCSYTIHIYLKTIGKIINGWSKNYYQWDATALYSAGSKPKPGDASYYNPSSGSAVNSCKDCPSQEDVSRMMVSGVYWDDKGPAWKDYMGYVHTTGVWVMKKSKWQAEANGTSIVPVQTAGDMQRTSDDYIFIPASGCMSYPWPITNTQTGYYWTSTSEISIYFDKDQMWYDGVNKENGFSIWTFKE